ncbi:MAG: O-antigen ligase domain-containing protein [Phenylobacterium sp.]|nr:MAG: O-antigen ligase domain-containing protein [Phenylobacterium sp.]
MTSAWDARPTPPVRRIRGGGEAEPAPARRPQRVQLIEARSQPRDEGFTWLGVDIDGAFALALFLPMLYLSQWTSLGAAAIAGLTPLYMFVRRERLLKTLTPRAFLLLLPAVALFSVVWSIYPKDTLRHAVELGITVMAGLLISSARNQMAVLRGIALAYLIYMVHSTVAGGHVVVGVGMGGEAFSGLTESKNLQADIASCGVIVTTVVVVMALQRRAWMWALGGFAAIALDLFNVVGARSAGAMLGLGIALVAFAVLIPLVYAGKAVRAWLTTMLAILLPIGALSYQALSQALIGLGAAVFDKDSTLTGRTYLWYRAADLIREHPILGRGYNAFWVQGNTDAEGLWQYFGIDGRDGFTFHNTYVQTLVELGWVGLIAFVLVVGVGGVFLIRRFVTKPTVPLVFWIGILIYELVRTPIEVVGVLPFYFSTVYVFGALGAGFKRERGRPAASVHAAAAAIATPVLVSVTPQPAATDRWGRPQDGRRALRLVQSRPEDGR